MSRKEMVTAVFLVLLVVAGAVAGHWIDHHAANEAPYAAADDSSGVVDEAIPSSFEEAGRHLSDCRTQAPAGIHPNFVSWEIDRYRGLFTMAAVEWNEGEPKSFNYRDPACEENAALWGFIEYALKNSAAEGVTASDAGDGP